MKKIIALLIAGMFTIGGASSAYASVETCAVTGPITIGGITYVTGSDCVVYPNGVVQIRLVFPGGFVVF